MTIISVVIPAYNSEKTIQQTINSILNQTFQNFEIIVINDGSTDSTADIVSGIPDSRIKVFSYANSGASTSRNRGFALAKGEYIALLDADDLWTTDKLESQYQALQNNPQAAVAYSWTDYIDQSGKFLQSGRHPIFKGNVYPELLVQNFLENGSNPLIRRQALIAIGGFDESLLGGQDWDFYIRLAQNDEFVVVPHVQILYRVSSQSISSQLERQEKQCLQVIKKAFSQAPTSLQPLKKKSLAHLYKYLAWKSLNNLENKKRGYKTAGYMWKYAISEPEALRQWKFILIMFIKSGLSLVFRS